MSSPQGPNGLYTVPDFTQVGSIPTRDRNSDWTEMVSRILVTENTQNLRLLRGHRQGSNPSNSIVLWHIWLYTNGSKMCQKFIVWASTSWFGLVLHWRTLFSVQSDIAWTTQSGGVVNWQLFIACVSSAFEILKGSKERKRFLFLFSWAALQSYTATASAL